MVLDFQKMHTLLQQLVQNLGVLAKDKASMLNIIINLSIISLKKEINESDGNVIKMVWEGMGRQMGLGQGNQSGKVVACHHLKSLKWRIQFTNGKRTR